MEGCVNGGAGGQRGGLFGRGYLLQSTQKPGDGIWIVQGGVGADAAGQRSSLLGRARLPQGI